MAASAPLPPLVVQAPGGAYAVAAPGLSVGSALGPALAGPSVVWTTSDLQSRLLTVEQANPDGTTATLYSAPPSSPPDMAWALVASPSWVAVTRERQQPIGICDRLGCRSRSDPTLLAGPPGGRLRRVASAAERFRGYNGCRRGTRIIETRLFSLQLSGSRLGYERRVACRAQGRHDRLELIVHDLRSGARRVLARTAKPDGNGDLLLAGDFAAIAPPGGHETRVVSLRSGATVYATRYGGGGSSLDADGTLAFGQFQAPSLTVPRFDARLGWVSPREPRLHNLALKTSIFSSEPLLIAKHRIAYVHRLGWTGYALAITDLQGHAQTVARFTRPEELDDFAFDGDRIAWVSAIWRPYRGHADDGLPYRCDNGLRVMERAPIVEVHPIGQLTRIPVKQLPDLPPPRDPAGRSPHCPPED